MRLAAPLLTLSMLLAAPMPLTAQDAPPATAPDAPAAATEAPKPEPTEEERQQARAAYGEGQTLFSEEKYEEARAAFQRAYDAVPNPVVLLSLAESLTRLGKLGDALSTFKRYLSERSDAPDRSAVESKIAEIEATPAILMVTSEPDGARIILDGQDTGQIAPARMELPAGSHSLQLTVDGYEPVSDSFEATPGSRHELNFSLTELPPPEPVEQEEEPVVVAEIAVQEVPTTALWVTNIVGAAGLVGGTVLGFMALAENSDFDAHPTEASADRGEKLALFADVAFGVGAMAIITGLVLYLTAEDTAGPQARAEPAAMKVVVIPAAGPGSAQLSARVSF